MTGVVFCNGTGSCTWTVAIGEGSFFVTVFVAVLSIFATEGAPFGAGPFVGVELLVAELLGAESSEALGGEES